jgi:hypothetical protein
MGTKQGERPIDQRASGSSLFRPFPLNTGMPHLFLRSHRRLESAVVFLYSMESVL